jgi:hypothetical protein
METVLGKYKIEIVNDSTFTPNSTDNINSYDIVYSESMSLSSRNMSYTQTAIKTYENSNPVKTAIICEPGGVTIDSETSFVIDDSVLYIIAKDMVYSLNIPDLSLNWSKAIDSLCCLAIHRLESDFLVHGELDIIRIGRDGQIKWRFGGRENWINPSGKPEVTIKTNHIELIDFDSYKYIIDFNGKEKKIRKKWWKIK